MVGYLMKQGRGPLFLTALIFLAIFATRVEAEGKGKHNKNGTKTTEVLEFDEEKEFHDFCEEQQEFRRDPENVKRDCKRINEKDFHRDDLRMLFMVFVMILWGAIVRTIMKVLKITLPYTVVLMLSGMILGIVARYQCFDLYTYTSLARVKPDIILFVFLPVLIFETAFGISSQVFIKACAQILILAFPGMLVATGLTAIFCWQFFSRYEWTLLQSLFYGSIISATDPVAVVAILKEVGVADSLSVIVDGESLLNDGVAILLFEIFQDLVKEETLGEEMAAGALAAKVTIMFFRIAIGGPIFGFIMAKIAIFCLSKIFNDATVEVTITLISAYLTYYLAEDVLGVSGVCAVVLLGLTLSAEKTCISPDILEEVHEFWEMAVHLANTVLFVITGIVITERGSRDITGIDVGYLILLYCGLNFIRFIMLLLFSPLLSRCGYGLTWQNMIVIMYGGLRGGVGICLSLKVYEDVDLCDETTFGPKILFLTAGIVLLTLIVNGTTTKMLLDMLGLTTISAAQFDAMHIAVRNLTETQEKSIAMLKHDRYLSDANWDYINTFTAVVDPYCQALIKQRKPLPQTSLLSVKPDTNLHPCPDCQNLVENEPSNDEYRSLTEEARLKVLKALTISYWRQFEEGTLTEEALKILVGATDVFTNSELGMIHTNELKKYWETKGALPWLRTKLMARFGPSGSIGDKIPPRPEDDCRGKCWWLASRTGFEIFMAFIVLLSLIPAIWLFILDMGSDNGCVETKLRTTLLYFNSAVTIIFLLEFFLKILGYGCKGYWSNKWNYVDFLVLLIGITDLVLSFTYPYCGKGHTGVGKILRGLRLFRVMRVVKMIRFIIPGLMTFLNGQVNRQMFFGYNVLVGYLTATEDVLKYVNQMIENRTVAKKLKGHCERERADTLLELGTFQKEHPGIAIAVKTRLASRNVLNQMRKSLDDLRMDGLLDEKENYLLTLEIEAQMKNLWSSPSYIPPVSPEILVENLPWAYGNVYLKDFVFSNAEVVSFNINDVIARINSPMPGLYIITRGVVKIVYEPQDEIIENCATYGAVPVIEIFGDFRFDKKTMDYYTSGCVIGESCILTRRPRNGTVTCESETTSAYFIPKEIIYAALEQFNELESRLWRSVGIRRATAYLPTTSYYQSWPLDKIQIHIERSCCPIGPEFNTIVIPPYVLDIFVIEGYVQDAASQDMYVAPCMVSRSCTKLVYNLDNPKTVNRILLITQDNIDSSSQDALSRCVVASYKYRRGLKSSEDEAPVDKPFWSILNFGVRQNKRKKSKYNPDDEKTVKDDSIRRRRDPNIQGSRHPSPEASDNESGMTGLDGSSFG